MYSGPVTGAQSIQRFATTAEGDAESALSGGDSSDVCDHKHDDVGVEQNARDGIFVTKKTGDSFGRRGEREAQTGATSVAASSVDAHKRAAGWAKFWTRLIVAGTAENSTRSIFHAID